MPVPPQAYTEFNAAVPTDFTPVEPQIEVSEPPHTSSPLQAVGEAAEDVGGNGDDGAVTSNGADKVSLNFYTSSF